MIITAALAWYDEPEAELAACVRALRVAADRIVALDGAYRRYPGGKPRSPAGQARVIRETAAAVGLDCLVLQPNRLWAGQIEKRTHLLAAAAIGADWVMTVDADHVANGDRDTIRGELERVGDALAVCVPYTYPINHGQPMEDVAATLWAEGLAGSIEITPHFFRAIPGLRVERRHWWYSGILPNGERVWMFGDDADHTYRHVPHAELTVGYHVEHRCFFRTREKILGNRAFCNDRVMVVERTGQEDDMHGLPAPVFDYRTRLV